MRLVVFAVLLSALSGFSQTKKDSLKGGLRPERLNYDVLHYDLNIHLDVPSKSVSGFNAIRAKVQAQTPEIQIDLAENLVLDSIILNKQKCTYKRIEGAVFVTIPVSSAIEEREIEVYYHGNPIVARNAPWDGGLVFRKSKSGAPFVGVAVQGLGASAWFPCKDSQSDEPDFGVDFQMSTSENLPLVSNGRLISNSQLKNGHTVWHWRVTEPINAYNITFYLGKFQRFEEVHKGLDLDFWMLEENASKFSQFKDETIKMLDCFNAAFGEYPFSKDGFKLVEAPYLGMEHQSAVAYGNRYSKGYAGNDLSRSGAGMLFDFILVHEAGHEWFGNSITTKDIADMWVHEGFTTYSEIVYLECAEGKDAAYQYLDGIKDLIGNDIPIIGRYGINEEGSGDMYFKGANIIQTIRNHMNDDAKFKEALKKMCLTYQKQIVTSAEIEDFWTRETASNLKPVFDIYLRTTEIPKLEVKIEKSKLKYRWLNVPADFVLRVPVLVDNKLVLLEVESKEKSVSIPKNTKSVQPVKGASLVKLIVR